MIPHYTKSFPSAAAMRNFFKKMKGAAIFNRKGHITLYFGDGTTNETLRVKPPVDGRNSTQTVAQNLGWLTRETFASGDENHIDTKVRRAIDEKGGVIVVIEFA